VYFEPGVFVKGRLAHEIQFEPHVVLACRAFGIAQVEAQSGEPEVACVFPSARARSETFRVVFLPAAQLGCSNKEPEMPLTLRMLLVAFTCFFILSLGYAAHVVDASAPSSTPSNAISSFDD
jgi:hypothetical protein